MKFMKRFMDVLKLKPFDEREDAKVADSVYANSTLLTALIVSTAIVSLVGLFMAFTDKPKTLEVLCVAIAMSAITTGFEWKQGLKGRAKNQLFSCVLLAGSVLLIRHVL